jgi:hypothetical protein
MMAAKNSNEKALSPAVSNASGHSWPARHPLLFTFLLSAVIVWVVGAPVYIYFYPHLIYKAWEKTIVNQGVSPAENGAPAVGIPVNTLYAMPDLASPDAKNANLLVGANHDTLYTFSWLDLSKGPQVLHVPDMAGRYYSVEFVDSWGDVFAYVGRRTTGTQAGDFLITGPGWHGTVPAGLTQIASPDNTVFLIGRVLVESDSDLATAYDLSKQIQLTPLSHWQPGQ